MVLQRLDKQRDICKAKLTQIVQQVMVWRPVIGFYLTFTTLRANSGDDKQMVVFLFSQHIGFVLACKLSHKETFKTYFLHQENMPI